MLAIRDGNLGMMSVKTCIQHIHSKFLTNKALQFGRVVSMVT